MMEDKPRNVWISESEILWVVVKQMGKQIWNIEKDLHKLRQRVMQHEERMDIHKRY
jgi:hypothetical protein